MARIQLLCCNMANRHSTSGNGQASSGIAESSRRSFLQTTLVAGGATVSLSGCLGEEESNGGTTGSVDDDLADQINLYTFGGANGDAIYDAFAESFQDEYGVSVNHQTITSGWDLIPQIQDGSVDAHVVEQNPDSVLGGVEDDVWQPLRLDNVSDLVDSLEVDRFRGDADETTFDPGEEWHYAPKEVFAHGLVYNTDHLDEPTSWDDIYTDELSGQVSNTAFVDLALGLAGRQIGVDFDQIDEDESVESSIWDRIDEMNDHVYQWWDSGSTAQQLLTRESVLATDFWYGRAVALRDDEGVPIDYTIPEEGSVMALSCWTVGVEEDPGRYTAEKFINHTVKAEPSEAYSHQIPYYRPFSIPNPSEAYEQNPDNANIDDLRMWDYQTVLENREDWDRRFQEAIQ